MKDKTEEGEPQGRRSVTVHDEETGGKRDQQRRGQGRGTGKEGEGERGIAKRIRERTSATRGKMCVKQASVKNGL